MESLVTRADVISVIAAILTAIVIIGSGTFAFFHFTADKEVSVDAVLVYCQGWVDGFRDAATPVLGPPPDGWEQEQLSSCITGLPSE